MTRILIHLAFALALLPSKGHAFWGPKNFDDCILQNMKGVTSDDAADMIYESCLEKFSQKQPAEVEIPPWAINKLDAIAGETNYGYFKGDMHNGNSEWIITKVTIALVMTPPNKTSKEKPITREYEANVYIPPLTTREFSFNIGHKKSPSYGWILLKASGLKAK